MNERRQDRTQERKLKVRTAADTSAGSKQSSLINKHGASRMIAYCKDMQCLRFHIAQELKFHPPERQMMVYKVYGTFALAGLEVREPGTMAYCDGI